MSGAVYLASRQDGKTFKKQSLDSAGGYAQMSVGLTPWLQTALRYAAVWQHAQGAWLHEAATCWTFYLYGDHVKWQVDAGGLFDVAGASTHSSLRVRAQLQLQL